MQFHFHTPSPVEFGRGGMAPRWLSLTGCLNPCPPGTRVCAQIGQGAIQALWLGPDGGRLAECGDFNFEFAPADLLPGSNEIRFEAVSPDGRRASTTTSVLWHPGTALIPPCQLDVDLGRTPLPPPGIQQGDGRWQSTEEGWRTAFPAYDRFINLGDRRWENYEVYSELILHGWRRPNPQRDAGANVVHFGIALRWPGHTEDGHQPRIQWYPLGIAFEWRVDTGSQTLRLRGLDPASVEPPTSISVPLIAGGRYGIRARVTSAREGGVRYRAKAWPLADPEPVNWHLVHHKQNDPVRSGSALLVAHYTDITIIRATIQPATDL